MELNRAQIIETLTGVTSYKKNYYVELQKKIDEVTLRNKQLEIINSIVKSFNLSQPISQILHYLAEKLAALAPIDDMNLAMLVDGECRKVIAKLGGEFLESTKCCPNSICRRVIKSGRSLVYPGQSDGTGLEQGDGQNPGSAIYVPLMLKNKVIGILNMRSRLENAYSPQDEAFLQQVAEHLSIGLNNMRLFSEVRQREREWEDSFRAITDAIVIIDSDYRISRSNEIAKNIFGLKSNDLAKKRCYEIIHQRIEPCTACPMSVGASEARRMYRVVEGHDKLIFDVNAYPMFRSSGQLNGVFEVYKDVTQQVRIEAQLIQSEKLAAIGKLAAGVAHELNSPLTAILGNSQLLLKELSPQEESYELLEDIKQCGVRCKTTIQNLLSFARQQQLEGELISIQQILSSASRLVGHQIRQEGIEIVCIQPADLPKITGNGQQLEQVIVNLVINAKDALIGRGENKKISVISGICTRESKEYIHITVEDNGCGIAPEHLPDIFTPFYTTKEAGKGTGLGLSVSLGIVQNHGGTIECESAPGAGSKFSVLLPLNNCGVDVV